MKTTLRQFFFGTNLGNDPLLNTGWLLFRLHTGLSIAIHAGWPKMNTISAPGWFVDQIAGLGFIFPSPGFWAAMASWGEFVGGLCIAFGFLTRFSAIQLAFQFFVIAFLWYDNPEPVTGMYFQHTLFWCFVLLSFGGGGRYSLDRLIMNRKKFSPPVTSRVVATSILIFVATIAGAQNHASVKDFRTGKWKGTLTYIDYNSGQPYTMPANMTVTKDNQNQRQLVVAFDYSDEPKANVVDTMVFSTDGSMIDGAIVRSRSWDRKTQLVLVTEKQGIDGNDNRKATIRQTYIIGKKLFIIRKEVLFEGEEKYMLRNEYKTTR